MILYCVICHVYLKVNNILLKGNYEIQTSTTVTTYTKLRKLFEVFSTFSKHHTTDINYINTFF